jgi:hypothetical protein
MKNTTCTVAFLTGMAAFFAPFALADDQTTPADSQSHIRKAAAAIARSVGINTTWAETGVSATGIASSDFLHNDMTKPAAKPLIGQSSAPANVPSVAPADPPILSADSTAPAVEAPVPAAAASPASKPKPKKKAASASSNSRPRPAPSPAPGRSYSGGKDVVTGGGKDVYVDPIIAAPAPLFELSLDGGYQSRYYHLGTNRVLSGGFVVSPEFASLFEGRLTKPEDTAVYYGGVSANWNGLGAGVKYVRGVTDIETRFSRGDNIVRTEYEELVANISYSLAVLPDGWLNVTGGYRAIFFDEDTFYNTDRFDDFYVTVGNAVIPYFRPSVTYHYLEQGKALGASDNTVSPGAKVHDGQLLVFQIDGQLGLPEKTGLPFDVVYYAQAGLDDELNIQTNNFDHNWTQVGVTFPIFVGPFTVSPNWNYNESTEDLIDGAEEHFWGVNVRFDF